MIDVIYSDVQLIYQEKNCSRAKKNIKPTNRKAIRIQTILEQQKSEISIFFNKLAIENLVTD